MSAIPDLTLEQWAEHVERLTHHAACRVLRHTWRGLRLSQGGAVPGGVDPADLAAEVITDVLAGKRHWDSGRQPDFLRFLCAAVDSKVSHLVQRTENRVTRRLAPTVGQDAPEFDAGNPHADPATTLADRDALDRTRDAIVAAIAGDQLVEKVFECLDAGITKPADIAVLVDATVQDVNNAQKRLRRKVESVVKHTPSQRR